MPSPKRSGNRRKFSRKPLDIDDLTSASSFSGIRDVIESHFAKPDSGDSDALVFETDPDRLQYAWEPTQAPITVRLDAELIARLERESLEIFRAITSRGSEIGGLLVGHVVTGGRLTVVVEDFEPIACSYSRGPGFVLSEEEQQTLREAIARRRAAGEVTVGFFRSNTRSTLSLREEDLALFDAFFPEEHNVFVLVKPFSRKPCLGGIFVRMAGKIRGESTYLEFPFSKSELERSGELEPAIRVCMRPERIPPASAGDRVTALKPVPPQAEPEPPEPEPPPPPPPAVMISVEPKVEPAPPPAPEPVKQPPVRPLWRPKPKLEKPLERKPPVGQATDLPSEPVGQVGGLPHLPERKPEIEVRAVAPEPQPAPRPSLPDVVVRREPERPPEPKLEAAPPVAEPAEPVKPVAVREFHFTAEDAPPRSKRRWPLLAGVAAVVVLAGLYALLPGRSRTPAAREAAANAAPSDPPGRALWVEGVDSGVMVLWNSAMPTISTARGGRLSIVDGGVARTFDLSPGDLKKGGYTYEPRTDDLTIRLDLDSPAAGRTAYGMTRILGARRMARPVSRQRP